MPSDPSPMILQGARWTETTAPQKHDTATGGAQVLLSALTRFVTLILQGKTPLSIRPFFFGASLTALTKKEGGIRPIAVGCTLRRLFAKVAGFRVRDEMATLLAPRQLGYGVRGGAEAAVLAARFYLQDMQHRCVLKLDFMNAFNTLRRDKILQAVHISVRICSLLSTRHLLPSSRETKPSSPQKG